MLSKVCGVHESSKNNTQVAVTKLNQSVMSFIQLMSRNFVNEGLLGEEQNGVLNIIILMITR